MTIEIFQPLVAEGFEWLGLDPEGSALLRTLRGGQQGNGWRPISATLVRADGRERLMESDFPWYMGSVLIMRPRAVDRLHRFWTANGELLPMSASDGAALFAFNSQVVNALDATQSELTRFSSGRVSFVSKPVFVAEAVADKDLFRVSVWPTQTYVSGKFVQAYKAAGLKGLTFIPQWSSGA